MEHSNNLNAKALDTHGAAHVAEHKHTSPRVVFVALLAMTVIEIITAFIPGLPRGFTFPFLLAMSLVKFTLVALYYMHLRYEKLIYGFIFVTPTLLGLLLISVLMA